MRLNIIILAITISLGVGLTLWLDDNASPPALSTSPVITTEKASGDYAPDFSFTDIKGTKYNITDFRGKIVILNFWATWCAPCVIEFPKLVKLAESNQNIVLLALSSDIADDNIHKFLKKYPANNKNIVVARDEKRRITADIFQTYKLPETYILSTDGKIVKKIVGDTDWNGKEISDFLSSLK